MVKKVIPKKKTKEFTINFKKPITAHILTLKCAKKWLEQNINKSEEEIKISLLDKNTLEISIDNSINFPKRKIISLVKNFLKIKKAKYYRVSSTSPNDFSVIGVK